VWVFRGIPYARTGGPAGRFEPPAPVVPWAGVRDAGAWGPIAPQAPPVPGFSLPGDPTEADEDCLNLNVWTPGPDDGGRPVLVWVHGGGFTTGTGASALYDGRHLAAKGVVVVTINYRLGALGLLAHPDLATNGHGWGNWGLRDQIAALRWVRDNIGAFGGDPGNVTVMGESAGAMSIGDLLASSESSGLFHRAVLQSGPPATAGAAWAVRRAERLAVHAGVDPGRPADLRAVPASALVAATQQLAAEAPAHGDLPLPLLPVVDGALLEAPPGGAVAEGSAVAVPLLVGTTRDEATLFTVAQLADPTLDEAAVVARLAPMVGEAAAAQVVEVYRRARAERGEPVGGGALWSALTTDYVFRVPLHTLATWHAQYQASTYAYLFTWASPFLGGMFGSCHGLDIPFVFGTVADPAVEVFTGGGPGAAELTEQMQRAWIAFATTGDPSCDEVGAWPTYDPVRRPTMVLGPGGGVHDDPRGPERRAWGEAGVVVGAGHHHV